MVCILRDNGTRRTDVARAAPPVWAVLFLGTLACRRGGDADLPPTSRITCAETTHDFGDVLEGETVSHAFVLRNEGRAPLHLTRVDGSTACSAPSVPGALFPGGEAALVVTCHAGARQGPVSERVLVHSDDPSAPTLELRVQAHVEPLLSLTSRTIDLKMAYGEGAAGEVRLTGRMAASARLTVRSVEPAGPSVTIVPQEGVKPEGVRVACDGGRVGQASGQIALDTGLSKPATLTLLYSWQVAGNLTVSPTNPFIDSHAAAPGGADVRVSSRRSDFRLDRALVVDGPFVAAFHRDEAASAYVVHVEVSPHAQGDARGSVGTLRLLSNDPAEPRRDVPLFALGAFTAPP